MTVNHRNVRLDLFSSKEVAEYLRRSDLAILPVGCFEMHGPLMPLATDAFEDWAMGLLLAEQWQCVCFPPIFFNYPGASAPWPGTTTIGPEISVEYVKAVVLSAIRGGFKRLVICACHGPMGFMAQMVIRSIHLETGHVVVHLNPYSKVQEALQGEFGFQGEDVMVLGALHVLGMDGAFDPSVTVEMPMEYPLADIGPLKELGVQVPWTLSRDYQHTGLNPRLKADDAARSAQVLRGVAAEFGRVPELFASYQEAMKRLYEEKPWDSPETWSDSV